MPAVSRGKDIAPGTDSIASRATFVLRTVSQSVSHYRTHTTEHTVPLHTLIFCTSVRWNLSHL